MALAYCAPVDLDAVSGQCTHMQWVDNPSGGIPPLTAGEGLQIGFAIVGAWAIGLTGRLLFKAIRGYF